MKLESWTLFIDMLGYREINGAINTEEEAKEFIEFMKFNKDIFEAQDNAMVKKMYESKTFDLYHYYQIQVKFISDSLLINYYPKEVDEKINENLRLMHSANALFIIIGRLQTYIFHCMREKRILVRGGISNKYCLIDENFAVGEGLIDAYHSESKIAIYPRIVLSKSVTDNSKLITAFNFICSTLHRRDSFIEKDDQGISYIDYLKYNLKVAENGPAAYISICQFLELHRNTIKSKLLEINERIARLPIDIEKRDEQLKELEKIRTKILWLKEYHNRKVDRFTPNYRVE